VGVLELLGFKPTIKGFAARLMRALPKEDGDWTLDLENQSLRHPRGVEINFINLFLEYSRSPFLARKGLMEKYASIALATTREIPDLWVEAAPNLYPTLRSEFVDSTIEIRRRGSDAPRDDSVVFPFAGDLRVRLMYDFGSSLTYVRSEKLNTWGQPAEAVLERAKANLGRLDPPQWADLGQGVFQLRSEQSFEESFLQLDSVVRRLPFADNAVFMPCNRGILLAADGRSEEALEAMLSQAERMMLEAPWFMSSTMCRRGDQGWEVVAPPKSGANLARGMELRNLAEFYSSQKDALEPWLQQRGDDVYVCDFTVLKVRGQWQSYCVWGQGVRALLPVTDWVAVTSGGAHIQVNWQDVLDICGPRLQPTSESPPRFRVDSFPDAAELERLTARQFSF